MKYEDRIATLYQQIDRKDADILALLRLIETEREKNRQLLAVIEWQEGLICANTQRTSRPA